MKIIHDIKARNFFLVATLSTGLSFVSPVFGQTVSYLIEPDGTAIQLGSLGGVRGTEASGINDVGQVVGQSWTIGGAPHAFITGPNGMGITDLFGRNSSATAVNNVGEAVGQFEISINDPYHPPTKTSAHAFITGPNGVGMVELSPENPTFYTSASAINDAGQVAMISEDILSHAPYPHIDGLITGPHGVGMTNLGQLAGDIYTVGGYPIGHSTEPFGMNNAGQVVGWSMTAEGPDHAFITGPNGAGMTDLGTLGQNNVSMAVDISDDGRVVGSSWSTKGGTTHAFITGPNGIDMVDLGTLGRSGSNSLAYGINDAGQVVGWSNTADGSSHAFITGPDGVGMIDLNSMVHLPEGWYLEKATGINNKGQIIAWAVEGAPLAAVPEPETYFLMLTGLGFIGLMMSNRERTLRLFMSASFHSGQPMTQA